MILTRRDITILQTVGQVPFLSGQEIERLFFPSQSNRPRQRASSQRLRRLRLLRNNGYLLCPPRADSRHSLLYTLTRRGANAAGNDAPVWVKRGRWPASLIHYRLIARFYSAFAQAIQNKTGFSLLEYQGEYALRQRRAPQRALFGDARPISISPDGAALLRREADGGRRFFFLEADTGSESLKRIALKTRAYEAWRLGNGADDFYRRFQANPVFTVIFLAPTPSRSQNLRFTVQETLQRLQIHRSQTDYFFLCSTDLRAGHILHPRNLSGHYDRLL